MLQFNRLTHFWQCWRQAVQGAIAILLACSLSGCDLPQVSAESRLFAPLALDYLGSYTLPKTEFQGTRVGGLSALTYDRQRDRFYALSDDRSEFAPARFYTLKINLGTASTSAQSPNAPSQSPPRDLGGKPDSATTAPSIQNIQLESVTILIDENNQPFAKGAIDPEGLVLSPLGTLFLASEGITSKSIPPFIAEVDRASGKIKRYLPVPERYIPNLQDPTKPQGVQENLGFESLTVPPGGYGNQNVEPFRIFTATEAALAQDTTSPNPELGLRSRMLHYMVEPDRSLLISEHLYELDPAPEGVLSHGVTEMLALDQGGHFLSIERSFGLKSGFQIKLFQLASGGATDTSTIASLAGELRGIAPIRKQLLLDLSQLDIQLDNFEGLTFGPRLSDGSQSLLLVSDDNFQEQQITQFLLFRLRGLK
jgi:hypothetical protein